MSVNNTTFYRSVGSTIEHTGNVPGMNKFTDSHWLGMVMGGWWENHISALDDWSWTEDQAKGGGCKRVHCQRRWRCKSNKKRKIGLHQGLIALKPLVKDI